MTTNKLFSIVLVFCVLQNVQSETLEQIFDGLIKGALQTLDKAIENTETDMQNMEQDLLKFSEQVIDDTETKIENIINQTVNEINATIKKAIETGKDIKACEHDESVAIHNISSNSGPELKTCISEAEANFTYIVNDVESLKNQRSQLLTEALQGVGNCSSKPLPSVLGCVQDLAIKIISRFTLLSSAVTDDDTKALGDFLPMEGKITKCGADELSKVTSELASVESKFNTCVENAV